jgi:hypothetical protein
MPAALTEDSILLRSWIDTHESAPKRKRISELRLWRGELHPAPIGRGEIQERFNKFEVNYLELILIKKRKIFPLKTNLTTCPKSLKAKESFFCVRAHFL